ncbi:hypothetical protein MRB53_006065 [Persea americana]|uniref:Uncharacterized protein n=1 Tax=Persea americana TaxID=3435 RepID=A0ACC2MF34_PERAE|nr:hypothetical protein MRB53_006065 [Persea americana]
MMAGGKEDGRGGVGGEKKKGRGRRKGERRKDEKERKGREEERGDDADAMSTRRGGWPTWFRSPAARDGEGMCCCGWRCCYGLDRASVGLLLRASGGRRWGIRVCARVLRWRVMGVARDLEEGDGERWGAVQEERWKMIVDWMEDDGQRWVAACRKKKMESPGLRESPAQGDDGLGGG